MSTFTLFASLGYGRPVPHVAKVLQPSSSSYVKISVTNIEELALRALTNSVHLSRCSQLINTYTAAEGSLSAIREQVEADQPRSDIVDAEHQGSRRTALSSARAGGSARCQTKSPMSFPQHIGAQQFTAHSNKGNGSHGSGSRFSRSDAESLETLFWLFSIPLGLAYLYHSTSTNKDHNQCDTPLVASRVRALIADEVRGSIREIKDELRSYDSVHMGHHRLLDQRIANIISDQNSEARRALEQLVRSKMDRNSDSRQ